MLNIINAKKGDIQFKFDNKYSAPQATIVTKNYWLQCFMEIFIIAPTLSFPIFFIIIFWLVDYFELFSKLSSIVSTAELNDLSRAVRVGPTSPLPAICIFSIMAFMLPQL